MSWIEHGDGVQLIVRRGECLECDQLYGGRDLAVCLADTVELVSEQRRITTHMAAVYHLDAPGMSW